MKMKFDTWGELGRYAGRSFGMLFKGLVRLPWLVILLLVNLAFHFGCWVKRMNKQHPHRTLLVSVGIMGVALLVMYADMRAKLTTAEWQRDSLRMKVDSAKAWHAGHVVRNTEYLGELDK